MAFMNSRLVAGLVIGIGLGATVARRRAAQEPCCDAPAVKTGACC